MITFDWFTIEERKESCTSIHNSLYDIPLGLAEFPYRSKAHSKLASNEYENVRNPTARSCLMTAAVQIVLCLVSLLNEQGKKGLQNNCFPIFLVFLRVII